MKNVVNVLPRKFNLYGLSFLLALLTILAGCNDSATRPTSGDSRNSEPEGRVQFTRPPVINPGTFQQDRKVNVTIDAFDLRGNPLSIGSQQLKIREDGRPIPNDSIDFATGPVSIALIIDVSGSMMYPAEWNGSIAKPGQQTKIEACCRAAHQIIDNMRNADRVAIITFNQTVRTRIGLTNERDRLNKIINQITVPDSSGETALFDAIDQGINLLQNAPGRPNIIVMTDGGDNKSIKSVSSVVAKANQRNIPIITIGYGYPDISPNQKHADQYRLDLPPLKRLSENTGGKTFQTPHPGDLQTIFRDAAKQAQASYPLTYRSPQASVGQIHQVEVEVNYHGSISRATSSYSLGFLGSNQGMPDSHLNLYFWLSWLGLVLLGFAPFAIQWVAWIIKQRRFYSQFTERGASARPGDRSPISDIEFNARPNELLVRCPECNTRHLYSDWVFNKGCARRDYYMTSGIGLGRIGTWYTGALVGAMGGLLAWRASWSVLDPIVRTLPINKAEVWLAVALGTMIGLFIGMLDGVLQQLLRRAFSGSLVGGICGLVAGFLGAWLGEWLFRQSVLLPNWLPGGIQELCSRMLSWGVVGGLIGASQYFSNGPRSQERLWRGLAGGFVGGALGGASFQAILQVQPSPSLARGAFAIIGGVMALSISYSVNNGRFWLVRLRGNANCKEFNLTRSNQPYRLGCDPSSDVHLKDQQMVAPTHAHISFTGHFVIEDMSRGHYRPDGTLYPEIQVNDQIVMGHRVLRNGDTIAIGSVAFRFEERSKTEQAKRSGSNGLSSNGLSSNGLSSNGLNGIRGIILLIGLAMSFVMSGSSAVAQGLARNGTTASGSPMDWVFFALILLLTCLLLFVPKLIESNSELLERVKNIFVEPVHRDHETIHSSGPLPPKSNVMPAPSGKADIVISSSDFNKNP